MGGLLHILAIHITDMLRQEEQTKQADAVRGSLRMLAVQSPLCSSDEPTLYSECAERSLLWPGTLLWPPSGSSGCTSGIRHFLPLVFKAPSCCAAPLLSLRMWWLSCAWLLIGATITNIIVWTPLLLDAALSGTFNGQLQAHSAASADPRAEVHLRLHSCLAYPDTFATVFA